MTKRMKQEMHAKDPLVRGEGKKQQSTQNQRQGSVRITRVLGRNWRTVKSLRIGKRREPTLRGGRVTPIDNREERGT